MEEQKKTKGTEEKQQKLTYEQLNDACNQLWQQNQMLTKRNKELEQFNMFKRLDYLFKVLEFKDTFSVDFVGDCVNEIEEAMTIPQTSDKEEN